MSACLARALPAQSWRARRAKILGAASLHAATGSSPRVAPVLAEMPHAANGATIWRSDTPQYFLVVRT